MHYLQYIFLKEKNKETKQEKVKFKCYNICWALKKILPWAKGHSQNQTKPKQKKDNVEKKFIFN